MQSMRSLGGVGCVAAMFVTTACLTPNAATAQGTEVTPFLAGLLPLNDNIKEDQFEFRSKHASGFGAGVRLAHWFTGRLGVEGSVAYASSDVDVEDEGEDETFGGNVLAIGATVLYALSAPESRTRFHVGAGPAIIKRGGDFYDLVDLEGTTDVGIVIGAGVRVPMGERLGISIRFEDFISSMKLSEGGQSTKSRLQNDVMISVGLAIPLGASR